MAYESKKPKSGEDFVVRLTAMDGDRVIIRIGRFKREAQRAESGRGHRYIQQGIKIFSTAERSTGVDGRQFPEAEYWDGKDFDIIDLPYITIWLLEASVGSAPESLEEFLQALGVFMSNPEPVPSEFFKKCGTPFNSIEDFFRQLDDFLVSREAEGGDDSSHRFRDIRRGVLRETPTDHSQLELFGWKHDT
jgi:hypothetical protein